MTKRNKIVTALMADSIFPLAMVYVAAFYSFDAALVAIAIYILGRDYLLNQTRKRPLHAS